MQIPASNKTNDWLSCVAVRVILFAAIFLWPAIVAADISLPKIFSDHMVLQQSSNVAIWGKASPSQEIEISFNDVTVQAVADAEGNWRGTIETPVAGGPYELEVKSKDDDTKVIFTDVLVGEVWICSGQSNMEWPISKSLNPGTEIENAKEFSEIRLFTVNHNATPETLGDFSKTKGWDVCNPESVADFSAVAYFFARELKRELKVPVGLIHTSWGGTRCEAWISEQALKNQTELAPLLNHWKENDDPTSRHRPSSLFNGMIRPLKDVQFRGFLWYQGEANVGRGHQYQTLFPTLIKDWREQLSMPEAPFYFVQLAPHRYGKHPPEALAEIWGAQLKTWQTVPKTGMVVTTDIGNLENIHPKNKQEVGRRLALWAMADTYADLVEGAPEPPSGPAYQSFEQINDSNKLILSFEYAEGLKSSDEQPLSCFTICGEDKVFVPAIAKVVDDKVIVYADEVALPVAVRFAWDDTSVPNLVSGSGLPASPFRTDDYPLLSREVTH